MFSYFYFYIEQNIRKSKELKNKLNNNIIAAITSYNIFHDLDN